MGRLNKFKRLLRQFSGAPQDPARERKLDDLMMLSAKLLLGSIKRDQIHDNIHEAEFKVFSQFGDDGIIQYLVANTGIEIEHQKFIEFGVENYTESNTRFLLVSNNWSGLVIDGNQEHIAYIKSDQIYWRHDLTAVHSFIDRDNINQIIVANGFSGEIGLLSIDLDGNDYWIWEAITVINPVIVIVEYNSVFGNRRAVTVPYDPVFECGKAHYSHLFWGCSLKALDVLAQRKGYTFVGSDSHGNNAYFVRNGRLGRIKPVTAEAGYVASKFREARDIDGRLSYLSGKDRLDVIKDMVVLDLEKHAEVRVGGLVD